MSGFPCACCGYLTRSEEAYGTYEICEVCFWEDDPVQSLEADVAGFANTLSLNESRENFKEFGACEERFIKDVRPPLPEELPS